MPRESSEKRRWTIYDCPECGLWVKTPADREFHPAATACVVMPVSEHEDAYTTLEMAVLEVVNQDRSTTDGEAEFEDAVHRLWLVLHAAGQKERNPDA